MPEGCAQIMNSQIDESEKVYLTLFQKSTKDESSR